jgi:predicted extracellular nuclease
MVRGALWIVVEPVPGLSIRLLNLHLISKLVTYPSDSGFPRFVPWDEDERTRGEGLAQIRRTAEAVTVRAYLNEVMQAYEEQHTIVLGDLNDEPRSATVQIVRGPEDADLMANDMGDSTRLYNLVDSIPLRGDDATDKRFLAANQRFTRIYRGRHELIDQILVSKGLVSYSSELEQEQWRVHEVTVPVDLIQEQIVGDNPVERINEDRPDHAPVYALFDLSSPATTVNLQSR